MSDSKKSEALAKFTSITGVDEDRAKFYMESSNWNLDISLASYYDDNEGDSEQDARRSTTLSGAATGSSGSAPSTASFTSRKPEKKKPIGSSSSRNITTLSNLKQDHDSADSSDEEEGQAFYAGGSEHSGQQVLGPPRGRLGDIVSEMFRSVREFGAEVVEVNSANARRNEQSVFGGTGYRLGETSEDTEVITPKKAEDQSQVEITLKFWKNGFSVNDGPLRSYDDPKNQDFLHHIKHGEVPNELIMQAQGREISFNMEDYRHAEHVRSAPKFATFSGTGQKLGSVTPTLSSPSPTNDSSTNNIGSTAQSNPVEVDNSKPTTNIQIRLADGSRLVGTFNHNHTIADIRSYINASSPQYRDRAYILLSSFPRKELTNNEDSIEQSGLVNSVVMQHLVA